MDDVWLTASYLHLDNLPERSKARLMILLVFQAFLEHGVPENPEMIVGLMQTVSVSYYSCFFVIQDDLANLFVFYSSFIVHAY